MGKAIVGIDPGLRGGIALISDDEVLVEKLPHIKLGDKKAPDANKLIEYFFSWGPDVIAIERQQSMPKQGVASTFTIGFNYGIIYSAAVGSKESVELIRPREWKAHFGLSKDKKQSIKLASILFPMIPLKDSEDGLAEALLIAEYVRQSYG